MKLTISTKSKFGFAYNSSFSMGKLELPQQPYHIGTYKKVLKDISEDRTFESLQNGTYYTSSWFVKHKKVWYRITDSFWKAERFNYSNKVEVEVENI